MKRVLVFGGGYHTETARNLNKFLNAHPECELLEAIPITKHSEYSLLYGILNMPDDVSGMPKRVLQQLGYEVETEEIDNEEETEHD